MTGQEKFDILRSQYKELHGKYDALRRKARKKMQFSQKICVFGVILVTAAWLANFALLWFGREPMSDVTIAIISMFGGFATGGYFALSGVRDCSLNKLRAKLNESENNQINHDNHEE